MRRWCIRATITTDVSCRPSPRKRRATYGWAMAKSLEQFVAIMNGPRPAQSEKMAFEVPGNQLCGQCPPNVPDELRRLASLAIRADADRSRYMVLNPRTGVTGVILAGGRAERMGWSGQGPVATGRRTADRARCPPLAAASRRVADQRQPQSRRLSNAWLPGDRRRSESALSGTIGRVLAALRAAETPMC